ncbi:hypothetical protein J2T37_001771 [Neisseria perflava]|nr:hypothetical protein [Neisseria perflava]MCP1773418.1 hypothetical protein [Neisseria perflava]
MVGFRWKLEDFWNLNTKGRLKQARLGYLPELV